MTKVAAVSDVHSPLFFNHFHEALSRMGKVSAFIMAGDMVYRGNWEEYGKVMQAIRKVFSGPLIGIFGNEEFEEIQPSLRAMTEVMWLDDDSKVLDLGDETIKIVGSRGSLLKPTYWQSRNIPGIRELYFRRLEKLRELLRSSDGADRTVLVLHYPPTFTTLMGENPHAYPLMGDPRMERVLRDTHPDICIHGHAHKSKVRIATIGETIVHNVSLPVTGHISEIELQKPKN